MKSLIQKSLIGIALVVCSNTLTFAAPTSPMHFNHVSLEDGLSQNNVQSILQDSTGYMWFATENGLNRYDGYSVRQYNRERGNPDGLTNDFIWALAEDDAHDIWLATQGGGVVRWNRETDTFTSFRHDPENPDSLASDDIRTLLLNDDGTLWVGTRDKGLEHFDPRTGIAHHFQHDPNDARSLSNDMVYALHLDSSGQLWIGTDGGANKLNTRANAFVRYQHDPVVLTSLSDDKVRTIYEDQSGTLWIGTSTGGLNRFENATAGFSHFRHDPADATTLSNDHVRVIFEDDVRRLWIGTADGLNLLDTATGTIDRYQHDPSNPQSLNDGYINSMYQDRGGLLWVGTRSAGVSKWNPRSWALGHYLQPWLSGSDVTSFASDGNGTLWVATLGAGLARIDESTNAVQRFRHRPGDSRTISDDAVMSLLLDRKGVLWIGTMSGGLNRLDPETGEIQIFRHKENSADSLAADGVMVIYEDLEGLLWIGTYGGGVSVFDQTTESFTQYLHNPDDPESLSDPRASAIIQDESGAMWIGTFGGGLNLLDTATSKFRQFHSDPDDPNSLADNTIFALHLDDAGNVWVGTAGGGLDLVVAASPDDGDVQFRNFSQQDGLPNNVINGIQSDSVNRLWLSTNFGLARFEPATLEVKTFHRGHGLQGEEFNFAAHHRTPDGTLYFGGANGFNAIRPQQVEEGVHAPNIVLTSYQKLSQPAETDVPYDRLAEIELGYQDDLVSFGFAALDFTASQQNTYSYRLDGFDDSWNELGTLRRVTYTNLDAGNYVLRIDAKTSDGVPAANGISIPVNVAPAPWATVWAYSFYVAVALALLWLAWKSQQRKFQREAEYSRQLERDVELRTEQLEERNAELEEASRAKSDFLARMSHEIRTPMNGMLGMTQLLMRTKLDGKQYRFGQTIKRSVESLLEVINDILDFSKIEAGRLELNKVEFNVSELVDETVELFSGAASEKGLELMCATPPGKAIAAFGDSLRLKQVLVNLLGNAIKFTHTGDVVLRFALVEEDANSLSLRFEIQDTGVGIQPESLGLIFDSFSQEDGSTSRRFGGTGLGLAICKQLVEMMGGEIAVESVPNQGSSFWFTVSLEKASPASFSRILSGRLANLNVLVVDNNEINVKIIADYLSAFGVTVVSATSGIDALKRLDAAAESTPFDLALIDADLGDMKGLDVARVIKTHPKVRSVKVALLNSADTVLDETEWRKAGVDGCLSKPIRQSMLYEKLLMLTVSTDITASQELPDDAATNRLDRLTGRVLLVEDNDVNQLVALGMLEELGCETVLAANGKDAIEHISRGQFDAVLMDCEMPVMDGFAATATIRDQVKQAQDVPIIALTANAADGDRDRCLAVGMQDYISKPMAIEKLHETLGKWLRSEPTTVAAECMPAINSAALNSIRNLQGVGGDKMVKRVVDLYLSRSSVLVESLRAGMLQGDAESVRQGAHALKSSSQNVGANALANLSQRMEAMGRSGQVVETERYLGELDEIYPTTIVALKSVLARAQEC